jgi:hypothetical protein
MSCHAIRSTSHIYHQLWTKQVDPSLTCAAGKYPILNAADGTLSRALTMFNEGTKYTGSTACCKILSKDSHSSCAHPQGTVKLALYTFGILVNQIS